MWTRWMPMDCTLSNGALADVTYMCFATVKKLHSKNVPEHTPGKRCLLTDTWHEMTI